MPEIVHYGGGSTIGLSNVGSDQLATPYILVADQFQNLGPLVAPPVHVVGPSLPQVNFTNTDVHVTGGKLNTQQIAVQGGYSSNMFSISDSLHISKVVRFPTDVPANVAFGAGCVDPHGIIYYIGSMGLGGAGGSVIVQYIAPTNTYSFIPFDYERYFIFAIGATTQSLYLAVYDNHPIFDDNWYVFILETNAFTITGNLDFGAYKLIYPQDIKFDSSGGIYVASAAKIYYFANESSTPTVIDPGRFISSIAIDSRNYIYAIDTFHGNAFCITTNVTYEPPSDINIGPNGPLGIAVDSNFEVYVNFYCADKIIKYFENGTYFYTINLQINLAATHIDIKGFDDLYVWSTSDQTVSVYKSVIEIGKVTRLIGDEFYGDGGTLSNVHVPADSVIQPFSNLKVLGTTVTSNLGIGTETPSFPLHLLLSTDTAQGAYPVSSFGSTSGWNIQFFSDDTLRSAPPYIFAQSSYGLGLAGVTGLIKFYDYNGGQGLIELMRIDSGGYVGIGTSTPGAQLDVVSSSTPDSGALISQFGSTSQSGRIKFYDNNVAGYPPYIAGTSSLGLGLAGEGGPIVFYNLDGTLQERMRITTSGNVGIGTSTPGSTLDVKGDVRISNSLTTFDISTSTFNTQIPSVLVPNAGEGLAVSLNGAWVAFGNQTTKNVWVYYNNGQFGSNIHDSSDGNFGAFLSINADGTVLAIGGTPGKIEIYARGFSDWYHAQTLLTGDNYVLVPSLNADGTRCVAGPYYSGLSTNGVVTGLPTIYGWKVEDGSQDWSIPYTESSYGSFFTVVSGDGSTVVVGVGTDTISNVDIYDYHNVGVISPDTINFGNIGRVYVSVTYNGKKIVAICQGLIYVYDKI
jgi:hypothetical protein